MTVAEQGETYAAHIEAELEAEHKRTDSLNARATAITTTSSAFLALVLALTALVTGEGFRVTSWGARGVMGALVLFVIASLLGLIAGLSREYQVTAIESLEEMVKGHWVDHEVDARNAVAYTMVQTIRSLRQGNNGKAVLLAWAAGIQLLAIAVLITALGIQLWPMIK